MVEDVERDGDPARRDPDLRQDSRFGHRREARAFDGRRPDDAAVGRIRVPVPVLRQPWPVRALAAPDGRALGEREQLRASVQRRDQLGLEPRPERERLQLGRERRMPALDALEHARAEAPHIVEPVPEIREQRQVGVQAERRPPCQRRSRGPAALAGIRLVGAQRCECLFGQRGHAGKRTRMGQMTLAACAIWRSHPAQ